jgi:hypothetical protein
MCSINHDLKAIFIHVHKTGGTYISYMLHKYYGFKNYYIHRPDHDIFCFNKKKTTKYLNYENRIHGVLVYYKTSPYINKKMNMTPYKWDTYYKFCFIRNPYDKIVSAWNHVDRFNIPFKNFLNLINKCNDVEYMHVFLPQVRNILDEKGKINIDYIGKFETLEEDFQKILKNIGIKNIIHDVNKQMNKRNHDFFYKYYDQDVLNKVNFLLKEDFELLNYPIIFNIDEFNNKYNINNDINNDINNINSILNNLNENSILNNLNENSILNNLNENSILSNLNEKNNINNIDNEIKIVVEKPNNYNIVILYAYYEKNNEYKFNFRYFLENAIMDNIDYYLIINGICTIQIPNKPNIKVLFRKNLGFDFGAYSYAVEQIQIKYDYYFFINTSVLGPFKNNENKPWTSYFIELFNENVKIVGTSINIYKKKNVGKYNLETIYKHNGPYSHIQTMFFVINYEYLKYLKNINFFNENELNKINDFNYIIAFKEIGLSQIALINGWDINCILPLYKNLDYKIIKKDINQYSKNGDPYYKNSFFGNTIKKEDVLFFKINRFI